MAATRLDPAPADPVARALAPLTDHLSPLNRGRLDQLWGLIGEDHRIPYAAAYQALFPGCLTDPAAKTRAEKTFDKLRRDLKDAAAAAGSLLELRVDQRRKAALAERHLWFITADDTDQRTEAAVCELNAGAMQALPPVTEEQYATVGRPFWLLVYALADEPQARTLRQAIETGLKAGGCPWEARDWRQPDVGEPLDEARQGWLADAQFVLVFVSPNLLAALKDGTLTLETDRPLWALALRECLPDAVAETPLRDCLLAIDADGWPDPLPLETYGPILGPPA